MKPANCRFGNRGYLVPLGNLHLRRGCVLFLAAAIIGGCVETSNTVTVQGNVSYRGKPLTKAAVTFFPEKGRAIFADLNADGDYTAELPPGEYTVTINISSELPPGFKEGDLPPAPDLVLPPEYTTRAKSKLTATVREGEPQTIDFPLE